MLVLLTSVARDRFGPELRRPGVEWLALDADGTLSDDGGNTVGWDDARPEIAWGTSDLFRHAVPFRRFVVETSWSKRVAEIEIQKRLTESKLLRMDEEGPFVGTAREGVITGSDLPPDVTAAWAHHGATGGSLGSLAEDWPSLAVLERRYIDRVLSRTGGNKTRAAEVLGIDRRTLNRMFARERAAQGGQSLTDEELDALADEDKT